MRRGEGLNLPFLSAEQGRGGVPSVPQGRPSRSPVLRCAHHSLSSQEPTQLPNDAGQGHPAGRLALHLHCGGETRGDR